MSWNYAEEKIRQALAQSKGNATRARQMIIEQASDDPKLMMALVRPHMTGITAHAVSRVMNNKTKPEPVKTDQKPANSSEGTAPKSKKKDSFGMDILKTIAGGHTAQFGQEGNGIAGKRPQVSQRHIDAINMMIDKSRNK